MWRVRIIVDHPTDVYECESMEYICFDISVYSYGSDNFFNIVDHVATHKDELATIMYEHINHNPKLIIEECSAGEDN